MPHLPILAYHNIGHVPPGARGRSLYVTPVAFDRQMALLRRLGYRGLSMGDALPYLEGHRHGKVAVITFDDGYVDNLETALPVLQRHGFTATCYMVSAAVGSYNRWDADKLNVRKPLMDRAQVRAWSTAGMEVGAHSRRHPHLSGCRDAELVDETAGSRAELEDLLGRPVSHFCYPYGDHDARVVEAVCCAGFRTAATTRWGRARPGDDLLTLKRLKPGDGDRLAVFLIKLVTPYEDWRGARRGRRRAAG